MLCRNFELILIKCGFFTNFKSCSKIRSKALYYSTRSLAKFLATLKIYKKSKFDWNQLKISKQHKNMYMYQKNY